MSEKEFYMWLGSRIKAIREEKGIKQSHAAAQAGIASGDLSKFENKGKKISAYRIKKLVDFIGVPMSEVFEEKKTLKLQLQGAN